MSKSLMVVLGLVVSSAALGALWFANRQSPVALPGENKVVSRQVMERAMHVVREKKPTPPQSSRFYAVVAKKYYAERGDLSMYGTTTLEQLLGEIVAADDQNVEIPVGEALWASPKKPFSPHAGKYERFVLDQDFTYQVPEPPLFGSDEYRTALAEVKTASENRSLEQGVAINFWGGVPGTEAPAGIWQNRLWTVAQKYTLSDESYAYAQMVLAESVADAFMECWKTKYTYWTKRPDMVDTSIQTAMDNPPFPAYVSGHSTISFTAATVLGKLFPRDADIYLRDAEEAKNSRLWAGIHFPHDNEEGKNLGVAIGEFVGEKLALKPVQP